MGPVFYSVESCIQQFFENLTTATRVECDIKATSLIGAPVKPMPIQGEWSYTVTGESSQTDVVQFRAGHSKLNMENINIAMEVHTKDVPKCVYHGQIGGQNPLSIYTMEKRPGVCYIQARNTSTAGQSEFERQQLRTAGDLARFFAEAWKGAQEVTPCHVSNLRQQIEIDLNQLSQELPARFLRTLTLVREGIPEIFTLPFVITHGDLNETNILVDDGYITGVIDWAEATIYPFGVSLWALENILGYMDGTGWHYHKNAKELRDEFWRVFETNIGSIQEGMKEKILLARMLGLFLRYGFEQNGSARGRVRDTDAALRYANAFCTGSI